MLSTYWLGDDTGTAMTTLRPKSVFTLSIPEHGLHDAHIAQIDHLRLIYAVELANLAAIDAQIIKLCRS